MQTFEEEAHLRLAQYYAEKVYEKFYYWGNTSGFTWFDAEMSNIVSIFEWANRRHYKELVIRIYQCFYFFLGTMDYWQERVRLGMIALENAILLGDSRAIADIQYSLGWTLTRQGRFEEAKDMLNASFQGFMESQQEKNAVWSLITLAKMMVMQGDLEEARAIVKKATELAKGEYDSAKPGLLTTRGRIELADGNIELARTYLQDALEATKKKGSGLSISTRLIDLGQVALAQNDIVEAEYYFQQGLESSKEYSRQDNIAQANLGMARVCLFKGNKARAEDLALISKEQFERMGMNFASLEVTKFLEKLSDQDAT